MLIICVLKSPWSQWQNTLVCLRLFFPVRKCETFHLKGFLDFKPAYLANVLVTLSHFVFASRINDAEKQGTKIYITSCPNLFSCKNAKFMKCFYRTVVHVLMLLWSLCDYTFSM